SCCGDVAWQLLLCGLACLRAVERQTCRRCGWCSAEVQFSWAKISLLADESIPASWNPMASCHPSCRVVGLADDPRARDMDNGSRHFAQIQCPIFLRPLPKCRKYVHKVTTFRRWPFEIELWQHLSRWSSIPVIG